MGTDDLFKKAKISKEKRESKQKNLPDRILILCEGEKTEPLYFNGFKKDFKLNNVTVEGLGANTDTIVQEAIKRQKDYEQVWCVFDRDSFEKHHFNRAFAMIKKHKKIKIAYSNEAFELWYLLHFNYHDTAISRTQYKSKLSECLGETYRKNSPDMYEKLLSKQNTAIKNAKHLLSSYKNKNPEKDNPSTNVYELVELLNQYKK